MSRMNCLRPSSGFCLNLRVLMVNSDITAPPASGELRSQFDVCQLGDARALEPKWLVP